MIYEILSAPKSDLPTEEALRAALAKEKPGLTVENITTDGSEWVVRLADGKPPWLDKDKGDSDAADSDSDASDSDSDSDTDSDSSGDSDDDSDSKSDDSKDDGDKKKGDPVAEVKNVINQLTTLFQDLGGKVEDLQAAHDDKAQKLKDISDTVGPDGADGGPSPEDIGPTPGKPPMPPSPATGLDDRKHPVPPMPGGGVPTFTHKYEIATHPGVDDEGKKISLTAAATAMEADPDFQEYEVVGMTENADGTFSAKLRKRD